MRGEFGGRHAGLGQHAGPAQDLADRQRHRARGAFGHIGGSLREFRDDIQEVRIEDLRGVTLLLLEEGHCLRDQALDVCNRVAVQENQNFRATSIETLRQMVAVDAGVTLLPDLATRGAYATARGVVVRPFSKPAPVRRIGAIWRKSSPRTAALTAITRLIAEHAL